MSEIILTPLQRAVLDTEIVIAGLIPILVDGQTIIRLGNALRALRAASGLPQRPLLEKPPAQPRSVRLCDRTTDEEYAAASGEPLPHWMERKR